MYNRIQETASWLNGVVSSKPAIAVILGSGLGSLAESVVISHQIPYKDIPHFPVSTVEGHSGNLLFGQLGGKEVLIMQGRFHYYEGYSMQEVTFPIRVMKALGIEQLMLSNAAGGLNPSFRVGDVMIIRDHLNLFSEHPLRGKNDSRLGPRFPDMSQAYSLRLRELATTIGKEQQLELKEGVYAGWQGPTFETPAEYKLLSTLGADACGMSTVPEVIVARHAGLEVFALSVITNCAHSSALNSHEDVQDAACTAQPKMTSLITELIHRC